VIRLLLVRHGETDWNVERRYRGQADVPLNKAGRRQVAALAERLAEEGISVIFSSDLQRARRTALTIGAPHKLPVQVDPNLGEIALGDWEGLTYAQIQQQWPIEVEAWFADPLRVAPPGGETLMQVAARVRSILEGLARFSENETVVLVSHGGPLRVLLCLVLGLDVQAHWQFRLDVASVSELYLHGKSVTLVHLNDTHHLDAL
jgi:alpha-ribazole phosphatase